MWTVVRVEKAGESCLEFNRKIRERLPLCVAEDVGFGRYIAVGDSSVMASEAEAGEVDDKVAGIGYGVVLIVGEITNFRELVLLGGSYGRINLSKHRRFIARICCFREPRP